MNDLNQPSNNEEVDLGQLFEAIGRMFRRLFDFIASIFMGIFLAFVWFVFFLKKNIILLAAILIIGLIVGFINSKYSKQTFQSSALIKQNYKTGENLYSTLEYYNDLISEGDSVSLAESLNMSPSDAGKIIGFDVSTEFNDNDKLILYDAYVKDIDTGLVDVIDFKTYVRNLEDYDYELQKLSINFTERGLFEEILNQIVNNISSIEFFKKQQERDLRQIERSQEIIKESLKQSDSLQEMYKRVLQINPELRENQTTITIEDNEQNQSTTKEYQLYLNDVRLRRELVILEREREDLSEIIEVISFNQNSGAKNNNRLFFGLELNNKFYYAVLYLLVAIVILLGMEFIKYLERYKNRI